MYWIISRIPQSRSDHPYGQSCRGSWSDHSQKTCGGTDRCGGKDFGRCLNYTPVAKVTNLVRTIEELKKEGIWFVCADMGGESMYKLDLSGPIGLVIGNEGEGVSALYGRRAILPHLSPCAEISIP